MRPVSTAPGVDPWLLDHLICPVDGGPLEYAGTHLVGRAGRKYPVVNGVPVMLRADRPSTLWVAEHSRAQAEALATAPLDDPYYTELVGVTAEGIRDLREFIRRSDRSIDPVVSQLVSATNGIAYEHLVGKLKEYPIPTLRLPDGAGRSFLDVGCNWGRWCFAAARLGYRPVGIDPSLGAVLAAKRVAGQLGVEARFVVADARHLPFRGATFDTAFSYSVIQHFSREDAAEAVGEIGRVLRPGGTSFVQMPTVVGLRCLYHQARRGFRDGRGFEVRYWTIPALRRLFTAAVGPTSASVDCFFGIGLQPADFRLMKWYAKAAITASELLRRASRVFRPLV